MRGYVVFTLSFFGLLGFSILLFTASNLFLFWLFLEMCSLCLVPLFFLGSDPLCLKGLFSYLVVSSISSSFMICGIICEGVLFLLVLGLLIKFGVFPFMGWVYSVINNSNWYVVWGLSTLLKSPFFAFAFFLVGEGLGVIQLVAVLSFIVLSILFWVYTYSWESCWCHMMLSSSASLIVMVSHQSLEALMVFFVIYLLWATLCIIFMSSQGSLGLTSVVSFFVYVFLLLSFPFSFSIFYKFYLSGCMFSCGSLVFFFWVFYAVSEQVYLLKFLIDCNVPRSDMNVFSYI
nr:NADH dehydrogenase subunit 2 [Glypthelmins sp. LW2G]